MDPVFLLTPLKSPLGYHTLASPKSKILSVERTYRNRNNPRRKSVYKLAFFFFGWEKKKKKKQKSPRNRARLSRKAHRSELSRFLEC